MGRLPRWKFGGEMEGISGRDFWEETYNEGVVR